MGKYLDICDHSDHAVEPEFDQILLCINIA